MFKKKCAPCYAVHPIVCGAVAGLAVIGLCGVVMAMKKKAKRLGSAARRLGCNCMESAKQMTEEMMESGAEAMERLANECRT